MGKTRNCPSTFLFASIAALACAAPSSAGGFAFVRDMGRGVNLGNELDAPSEGEWGVVLEKDDFRRVAELGLRHVRIPVRWDGEGVAGDPGFDRVSRTPPYAVDRRFFARVDSAIRWARENHLMVVVNDHHHESLFRDVAAERDRFLAIWRQISERYRDLPDSVAFELLNEPHGAVGPREWNSLLDSALRIVRRTNPTRVVVVGTADWGGVSGLPGLALPAGDTNLVLTVHDYEPMSFTHQGADWVRPTPPTGVPWSGDLYEKLPARQLTESVRDWARARNVPVWIGEFGAYDKADPASRARWAAYRARLYESMGFSWSWWELKSSFGIWNRGERGWNRFLTDALLSSGDAVLELPKAPEGGIDILVNGNFSGAARWGFNGSSRASFVPVGGAADIRVREAGANPWDVQLFQSGVRVRPGVVYVLRFDAWSSGERWMGASVGMGVSPWMQYASATSVLGPRRKTFVATFRSGFDDSLARVAFDLGRDTGEVHISDVRLLAFDSTLSQRRAFRGPAKP